MIRHDFYLAFRYLLHHRARSLTLIACLSLMAALPLGLHRLLDEGERQMLARADATPYLLAARGSSVDSTLSVLYFNSKSVPSLRFGDLERARDSGWAEIYPVFSRFRVQGHALVGVTTDYLEYRGLNLSEGEGLAILGDCLVGAKAALELDLKPGDSLVTAPENLFDLAGVYPLKLHVAGVLQESYTSDDDAIFIDLKTSWIIEGLGHGHAAPQTLPIKESRSDGAPGYTLPLTYTEITPENLDEFHFHGDPENYPVTAGIVVPHDERSAILLKGRYVDERAEVQLLKPGAIARDLMDTLFRITKLFDGVILAVSAATLLALGLVFSLSIRLREREIETIFLLGCSRATVFKLLTAELFLLLASSALVSLLLVAGIDAMAAPWIRILMLG